MRERAALIGGTAEIESQSGSGTTVFVTVPVAEHEHKMRMIAWGHSNKEIASRLNLSVKTIEAHKTKCDAELHMTGASISCGKPSCAVGSVIPMGNEFSSVCRRETP